MKLKLLILSILCNSMISIAQIKLQDTSKSITLDSVSVKNNKLNGSVEQLPDIKDNVIYAGKKTEVILVDKLNADLSTNNIRQIFAKVPGISIWENDGSGIQVGIATRGLSPNRSWEFNVRQNGYDISSEAFGYPETYYTPPMEAVSKIEVVRGAASLQFGPQFGGLINYQIKKGDSHKPITFETQQTLGSNGLYNTFNAIGGTYKKLTYYGFFHTRFADGWRKNSFYNIYTGYLSATYQVSKKLNIAAEYTNMNYKSQQPGGLTDVDFKKDSRQSSRQRNWFSAPFNVASFTLKYTISKVVNLQVKSFYTFAQRNSVGYVKPITIADTINKSTFQYNARQVDKDEYKNIGMEARLTYTYNLHNTESALATGVRIYNGTTKRNQLGQGTIGSDFDLTLTNQQYGRALQFKTTNYAVFAENIFKIGKRLKLVPGIRFEYIENTSEGYINTTPTGKLTNSKRTRQILLYGLGSEFSVSNKTNLYGNYSLAYRPVTFSELTPSANSEIIDPNLKDANGFNTDFGYRGSVKNFLKFDIGLFYLNYNDRIGTITQNGNPYKTNIGQSISKGIESYVELDIIQILTRNAKFGNASIFLSNSIIDAKYVKWNNPLIANDPSKAIENKRVENAPTNIHRFGASYFLKGLAVTLQYSSVGSLYTDAVNTEESNTTATIGKIAGYQVMDVNLSYKFLQHYNFKMGLNNMLNENYATRRATGYPGPGLMPSNGRTFFASFGAAF